MMNDKEQKKEKRPYEKPEIRTIELAADEVLAIGCKTSTAGWNFGGSPCVAFPCATTGS